MQTDEQIEDIPEKTRTDIERAIETVRRFSIQNESRIIPSLELFDIKNGLLEFQNRTSFEKTLHFTKQWLFPIFREKQKEKKKVLAGALQESVELIKIYSSALKHMQKGSSYDQELAEKLHQAISSYNAVVRQAKLAPQSLSGKIKQFIFEIVGWKLDEELIRSEIHLPETVEYSLEPEVAKGGGLSRHKVTVKKESKLTGLLENVYKLSTQDKIKPKKEELDAFSLKALTLLKNHHNSHAFGLDEMIYLLQNSPVIAEASSESHGYGVTGITLTQVLTTFPGEKVEITGQFQRDSFHPELCFPIKESFKLYSRSSQSGFPHPMQYIGFSLHEKLLPTFLLRPKALPKIQNVIEKNHKLARELLHQTEMYVRAKECFFARKAAFNGSKTLLMLLQKVMMAILDSPDDSTTRLFFEMALTKKRPFDFISYVHDEVVEKTIADPIDDLQRQWLLNNNPEMQDPNYCKTILETTIEKGLHSFTTQESPVVAEYQKKLALKLAPAACGLYLLQLSEHLGFTLGTATPLQNHLLTSLFRAQLLFIHELEEPDMIDDYEKYLAHLLDEEFLLFTGSNSTDPHTQKASAFAKELLDYFAFA